MAGSSGGTIVALGLAGVIVAGFAKALPASMQAGFDKLIAPGMAGATGGAGTSGGVPTAADIAAWAKGIGLPLWVGQLFVAKYGRLPASIPELTSWGDSNGYRVNGAWIPPAGTS